MSTIIAKTPSAYEYPLLIKNMFLYPQVDKPEQEIVYQGALRFTYRQFRERVARLAAALMKIGVKQGDTVAVMDWDSHRYLECFFAVPMIGAVLHTVNVRLSSEQLIYTIDHAEDDVMLVNAEFLPLLEQIKGRIDTIRHYVLLADGKKPPATSVTFCGEYEEMLAAAEPLAEFPEFDENTRATTFYTTGTTGLPKGVYFSHRQLVLHTLSALGTLSSSAVQGRFHREDVYMPITPMFHVHAWGIPYIATLMGVKQVYPGKYVPEQLLKLIGTEKVTFSHCVPTILNMLLNDPGAANIDFSHWKVIIGGASLPKQLAALAMKRGIDIFAGYGMSETCPVLTVTQLTNEQLDLPAEEQVALRTRTGQPLALVAVKLVNNRGENIPRDDKTVGEILVRTPWLSQGYLKDNSNSEKLWEGGWLHTQDIAAVNKEGFLRITDRKKDVIKVGGEWLSSLSIEDILASHPSVAEVAVLGQADPTWGEIPFALVVLRAGCTLGKKDLLNHLRGYVDRGILPREAILLKTETVENLEKTSVGKINKIALREKYLKA